MGFLDKLLNGLTGQQQYPNNMGNNYNGYPNQNGYNNYPNQNNYNNGYKNYPNQNGYNNYPNQNGYNNAPNQSGIQSLNLDKEQRIQQLNLSKQSIQSLCLEKKELNGLISRVCMVMDISGSMSGLYASGKVQQVIERLLPVAMQFDDNGVMEAWVFSNDFHRIPDISLNNFYNYINNNQLTQRFYMGGTEYAPVMQDIYKKYIIEEPAAIPTLVLFITDGDNSDKAQTTRVITDISRYPIFWQFVGIGSSNFKYLKQLDTMEGRYIDNANFFSVNDLTRLSDNDLYGRLLGEYPEWLNKAKSVGLIR